MTDPKEMSPEALAAAKEADEKLAAEDAAQLKADNKAEAKREKAKAAADAKKASKAKAAAAPKVRPEGAPEPSHAIRGGRRALPKATHMAVMNVRTDASGRVGAGEPVACTPAEAKRLLDLGAVKPL